MIQTYFGDGKGKTTAAIGAAIRCAGCGKRVLFAQFLKNNDSSEIHILEKIADVEVLHADVIYRLYDNLNAARTAVFCKAYNKLLFEDIKSRKETFQMLVLDEVLDAVDFGYIDEDKFLGLLDELREHAEIILTGHSLSEKTAAASDYISEVKALKHPYTIGVSPREGIEF